MTLLLKPGTSWWETYGRCTQAAPEAFDSDRLRNLTRGEWRRIRSLVASIATDDPDFGSQVAEELQAFKVGINKPRSRGDRDEVFGGLGASWKGAFVGGDLLVQALTYGPRGADEQLYGNFLSSSRLPPR